MYFVFITTLTNEIIGLLPITFVQGGFIVSHPELTLAGHLEQQSCIALAFAIGNFVLYYLGKFGSVPILRIFKKYKLFENDSKPLRANFFWIFLMRSIPFFPAKHVSIGLGIIRYNIFLFFLSSLAGIFVRGMILVYLFKLGIKIHL